MFSFRWVDPDHQSHLHQQGLDNLHALLTRADVEVVATGNRGRETVRVALKFGNETRFVYLKRERRIALKDLARHLFSLGGWWTKARAEFSVLQRLRAAGIDCPRPIACMQQGIFRPKGCLLLADLGAMLPLAEHLSEGLIDADVTRRARFFRCFGSEIARLHATGVSQPDLHSSHIVVANRGDGWRFAFLDFQRSRVFRRLPISARVRDLAALLATLSERLVDQHERRLLLDSYFQASGLSEEGGRISAGIKRRVQRLLSRRKIWEIRESDAVEHRGVTHLKTDAGENLWVDDAYWPALREANLTTFRRVMETTEGTCLRALKDRENWKLQLHNPHQPSRAAYLKKHHVRDVGSWMRAKLGVPPLATAGSVEARNVERLRRVGIPAMQVIAYGEKLHGSGLSESFVLTEELTDHTQLDHFLKQRFSDCRTPRQQQENVERRALIQQVAVVARRFHTLGYNHRDFYCCHFFIREPRTGAFEVNLIDLQRVEHRRRLRRRWLVKDLAQLSYSAPGEQVSRTDQMAFIKRYLDVPKLRPMDKRFIRAILAKRRRMQRNLGPHP